MRRRGFSMAEAVVCIAIVGVLLVAALTTAAFGRTVEYRVATQERGWLLARQLMAEITAQPYADPQTGTATFGRESGESGNGSRALWDDFDDYHGLSESPPRARDGTVMSDFAGWSWLVYVERINGAGALTSAGSETGLKSCIVIVLRNGAPVAQLACLRSDDWMLETH